MALGIAVVCLRDRCQRLVAAGSEANATRGAELHSAQVLLCAAFVLSETAPPSMRTPPAHPIPRVELPRSYKYTEHGTSTLPCPHGYANTGVIHALDGAFGAALTILRRATDERASTCSPMAPLDALDQTRLDPVVTSVRRVCAVCAQAVGLVAGRASSPAMGAELWAGIAGLLAGRLYAEPHEPGHELVGCGVIADGTCLLLLPK